MAKAENKSSTNRVSGDQSLAGLYNQLLLNRHFRSEAMRKLTAWLKSDEFEIIPPLPSSWQLEIGPQDELLVVTATGRLDARRVILRPRISPLKAVPLGPRAQAALNAMTFGAHAAKKQRLGWQERRVRPLLLKLYPPDGKVPDDVPTAVVHGQIEKVLPKPPAWNTINRILGRAPDHR
jgi:hypothetical protein